MGQSELLTSRFALHFIRKVELDLDLALLNLSLTLAQASGD